MHIAIAGNIGSGKTTLTGLLAKHLNYETLYENTDDNPYLYSFYEDMRRWSFNLQIYFLHTRFKQVLELHKEQKNVIQDRTVYEDAYIFAPTLHEMGLMNTRDFENYTAIFELLSSFIKFPDLLIYLRGSVPTLVSQIQKRGREYENTIRLDYLSSLNQRYEDWINNYDKGKLLVIDIEELNFADDPNDLGIVIDKINAEINGLF